MELIHKFESLQDAAYDAYIAAAAKYVKATGDHWMELENPIRFLEFDEDDEEVVEARIGYYIGFIDGSSEISIYDDEDDAQSDYERHRVDLSYPENLRAMIDLTDYINLMCEEL